MRKFVILLCIAGMLLVAGDGICQKNCADTKDYYKEIELFANALSIVQSDYVDEVKPKNLIYGALKGMISSLDPHSQFMDADEYREMKDETEGEFGGLGVEITLKDGLLTIVSPIEGTPAAKAGILSGDKLVKIDGKLTKDISLMEAVKKLRGKPGTTVEITVLRDEEKKLYDFKLTRALIKLESIKQAVIIDTQDKIGYIKLIEFQEKTARDLDAALAKLKQQGMRSLILDLRNNPGGLLNTAIDVTEKFIPSGKVIVSIKGRAANQDSIFKSKGRNLYTDFPMVVLVNKGSASGSEIVAGAIQDYRRAIILGTQTFGKGSVQTVIPMSDGSALRLTTAKYYTPNNKMINNIGIVPDIIVEREKPAQKNPKDIFDELDDKPQKSNSANTTADLIRPDNQLARAVDLIKGINVYKTFIIKQDRNEIK